MKYTGKTLLIERSPIKAAIKDIEEKQNELVAHIRLDVERLMKLTRNGSRKEAKVMDIHEFIILSRKTDIVLKRIIEVFDMVDGNVEGMRGLIGEIENMRLILRNLQLMVDKRTILNKGEGREDAHADKAEALSKSMEQKGKHIERLEDLIRSTIRKQEEVDVETERAMIEIMGTMNGVKEEIDGNEEPDGQGLGGMDRARKAGRELARKASDHYRSAEDMKTASGGRKGRHYFE